MYINLLYLESFEDSAIIGYRIFVAHQFQYNLNLCSFKVVLNPDLLPTPETTGKKAKDTMQKDSLLLSFFVKLKSER